MYGYDYCINYDEEGAAKGNPNGEEYQGLPDYSEIYDIIYNSDEKRAANSYERYIGAEVVLPDRKGEIRMEKVSKRIKYDDIITGEGKYNVMHDKSVYEVDYTDGTMDQLTDNMIAENMLSQVDSEGHHYQMFTELTDHKKDDSAITNVDGFIKSSNWNLHQYDSDHQ